MQIFFLLLTLLLIFRCRSVESFEELTIELSIAEEEENGTILLDLKDRFPQFFSPEDEEKEKEKEKKDWQRRFVPACSSFYLQTDVQSFGKIFVDRLDREELCPSSRDCLLKCHLWIQWKEMFLIHLEVQLLDIDDHRGRFAHRSYFFQLNEDLPLAYRLQLEQSEDKDWNDQEKKSYSLNNLLSPEDLFFPFELHFNRHEHLLELILLQHFDVHRMNKYRLELIVKQENEIEDQCLLEIDILPVDSLQRSIPHFDQLNLHFLVNQLNETTLSLLAQLQPPNDKRKQSSDDSLSSRFIPSSSSSSFSSSTSLDDLFFFNSSTGELFLRPRHSHEDLQPFYQFNIELFDSNSLSARILVQIEFNFTQPTSTLHSNDQDDDNEQSSIQIFIPQSLERITSSSPLIFIEENHSVPVILCQLVLPSPSSPSLNVTIQSSLINTHAYFQLKQVDSQSFEFILHQSFDFEQIQNLSIQFLFSSFDLINDETKKKKKKKKKHLSLSLDIEIGNVNDCPPQLTEKDFRFHLEENNPCPMHFFTFPSFDPDLQPLTLLTYRLHFPSSLPTDEQKSFEINSTTGQLFLLQSFDRERRENYSFDVCLSDQIFETCSSILLLIDDQNDNQCHFPHSILHLSLQQPQFNLPLHLRLPSLRATDDDLRENATLSYSFHPSLSFLHFNSTSTLLQISSSSSSSSPTQNSSTILRACDQPFDTSQSRCCSMELILHSHPSSSSYLLHSTIDQQQEQHLLVFTYSNRTISPTLRIPPDQSHLQIIGGSLNSSLTLHTLSSHQFSLHLSSSSSFNSTTHFPLMGTLLLLSLSSHPSSPITLHILIDQAPLPPQFFKSIPTSSFYYLLSSLASLLLLLLLLLAVISLIFCFHQHKRQRRQGHSLITTPSSTTTLSTKSIHQHQHQHQQQRTKITDTYYSFGDDDNHLPPNSRITNI